MGQRRIVVAIFSLIAGYISPALAQDFPSRPVTLIVPWPAGGTTDVAMRALARAAQEHLGQPIVIVNRPGASGTLGPTYVATTASADGYTITQVPQSFFTNSALRKTTFDPASDLTYVIGLTAYTFGVVVKSDAPWASFSDLLAYAKMHPGKIRFGSPGFATLPHLVMLQIAQRQGINWIHVPFKGTSETNAALLGGQVDAVADGSSWGPIVDSGKFRLLVTFGAQRSNNWPNVPTLKETGIDLIANGPYGIAGPKGMNPHVARILHNAFRAAIDDPDYVATLRKLDQHRFYMNSHDYQAFAVEQIAKQKQLMEGLGLKR